MNKKVLLVFLFIFLLLIFEHTWSTYYDPFKEIQDPVPFRLIDTLHNIYLKGVHVVFHRTLNESICEENLLLFNEIMNFHGIPYWRSEGTAWGVVRDSQFIAWDDDVDVSFMYFHREKFIKEVLPRLKAEGFVVGGSFHFGNFLALHRNGERLDIDIVQEDGKCVAGLTKNANTKDCNNILPYLNNMRQVEFLGTTFNVPGDDYLEYLYSSSWKTPKKSKFVNKKNKSIY